MRRFAARLIQNAVAHDRFYFCFWGTFTFTITFTFTFTFTFTITFTFTLGLCVVG
jgi:hypothetical protein